MRYILALKGFDICICARQCGVACLPRDATIAQYIYTVVALSCVCVCHTLVMCHKFVS